MTLPADPSIDRRTMLRYAAVAGATAVAGCSSIDPEGESAPEDGSDSTDDSGDGSPDRTYRLTAGESQLTLGSEDGYDGWTYDGAYPGPPIRATEGERVRVVLANDLPEETTVHWHGMLLRGENAMDGVPEVTQVPIQPGEEFVYEFTAEPAGTHWYHSHVGLQLDRELLGPLIVEERDPHVEYDAEHTLVLDEYLPGEPRVETARVGRGGMGGQFPAAPPAEGTLVNGSLPDDPETVAVEEGDRLRLRLINAAAATIYELAVDDHELLVTHADGPAVEPVAVDRLRIGMGERYDVIVQADAPGRWPIRVAPVDAETPGGGAVLEYEEVEEGTPIEEGTVGSRRLQYSDLTAVESLAAYEGEPDRTIDLVLSGGPMGGNGWTIDGQAYPDADPIQLREGEHVRIRMQNQSPMAHPMHLPGHHFRLGNALKDTVVVPGHMGTVNFDVVADNPGEWLFHCHHLYHLATGMARILPYDGG
ncbi:MAG: multicopper oxidase family protein [Haloferacaceae archaeon]